MEVKLQLCVFVFLIQVSLAVWQRVTVKKGQTLILSCPLTNAHKAPVDWKNPEGNIMFFSRTQGEAVKDKRYSIIKLSQSEFTISVSNVTFKDGGIYTCSQYDVRTIEKKVEVTVLGLPKMEIAQHDGRFVIKCTAEGNHHPPQIFWKIDDGPEILAQAQQVLHEDKKYVSMDLLHVRSVQTRVTVKCLVRHPALHSEPLMKFVKIGRDLTKPRHTTTTSSPKNQPQGSTEVRTTSSWFRHEGTIVQLTTRGVSGPSSDSPPSSPTGLTLNPDTSTGSHLSTSGSVRRRNDTISNATSTTGWTPVPEATEEIISYNHTEGNRTGSVNDLMQTGAEGSSTLLVFLVTCLIISLLVVVIFFTIKLRRAHATWKRENEDYDPSEDSSKSKSSQEEKNSQGQRRRGILKTAFTQYVDEKPAALTSVINTAAAATESVNKPGPQTPAPTSAVCIIKETEL